MSRSFVANPVSGSAGIAVRRRLIPKKLCEKLLTQNKESALYKSPQGAKNVRVLTFRDDAEKIAYSHHKNINRLQQTPVTYTRSIFQELRLRLGVTDEEAKKVLRRLYSVKYYSDRYKETDEDRSNNNVVITVFRNESTTCESFTQHNLAYLNFPLWFACLMYA